MAREDLIRSSSLGEHSEFHPSYMSRFRVRRVGSGLDAPRFMAFLPSSNPRTEGCGTLLVAERGSGNILRGTLIPGAAEQQIRFLPLKQGLNAPTSLSVHQGWVYVGESDRVSKFQLSDPSRSEVLVQGLPQSGHSTKTVLVHGDRLYVSIGSSCNSCVETDPKRAAVLEYGLDGSGGSVYSSGLRNSVGLAVNPWTGDIWATTNGRDHLGDDSPPDTVDVLRRGAFYGWPHCHGGEVPDPDLGEEDACESLPAPAVRLPAHSAPLGLAFHDPLSPMAAPGFPRGLYVALHGSWNRSKPSGHSIVTIPLDTRGRVVPGGTHQSVVQWPETVRPAGLVFAGGHNCGESGGLYVSDDRNGTIYLLR